MPDEQQITYVLGLDTCGAEASLALAQLTVSGMKPIQETTLAARTAGSLLTGALRDLLVASNLAPAELRAMAVVRGPGSFTGMRIGLSVAKALSEAAGMPLVAVSRLAVLAAITHADCVALDAGRGNLYVRMKNRVKADPSTSLCFAQDDTIFAQGDKGFAQDDMGKGVHTLRIPAQDGRLYSVPSDSENATEQLLTPGEFESLLPGQAEFAVCEPKLHSRYPAARLCPAPTALDALRFAHAQILARDWDDTGTLDALYLWRAEQMLARTGAL